VLAESRGFSVLRAGGTRTGSPWASFRGGTLVGHHGVLESKMERNGEGGRSLSGTERSSSGYNWCWGNIPTGERLGLENKKLSGVGGKNVNGEREAVVTAHAGSAVKVEG